MSALGDCSFKDCAFESQSYIGIWQDTFSFDYEAGATIYITPVVSATIPDGTKFYLYCSEDGITWTLMSLNESNYVTFENGISGTILLYAKLELYSYSAGTTPIISSLSLLIHQETSLYTIATQVLSDGLTGRNATWSIDTELQKYKLPYAWLKTMTHRKALSKIAEAAGGVAYQNRLGAVRVEAGSYISRKSNQIATDTIDENRIITMSSPASSVANKIEITTKPYEEQAEQVVWTLSGNKNLVAGQVKTFYAKYSDWDAVIDTVASITGTGASITNAIYRFGSADIEVTATTAVSITLSISGKPLKVVGSMIITESDGDSIRRYGTKTLAINENNLIQSSEIAEAIAEDTIAITKNPNRDVEIEWRGDPCNELGDVIKIIDTKGVMISQEFNFKGFLKAKAKMRRFL